MERNKADTRSIPELLSDIKRETAELIREEVSLARAELTEKGRRLRSGAKSIAAGGVLAFVGLLTLVAAAVLLLNLAIESLWLSSLIVGFVLAAAGGALLAVGRRQLDHLSPEETARSLRRDKELIDKHVGQRTADEASP